MRVLLGAVSSDSEMHDAKRIGKENTHQAQTRYHGRHHNPLHGGDLIFQVHEVADNQSGLDDGENHQGFEHLHRLKDLFVGENYLDCGEQQQYSPNPEVLAFAFIVCCGYGVHSSLPFEVAGTTREILRGWKPLRMTSTALVLTRTSHPRGHQIHQRENKHPDQIHEVPVESGDFYVMGIIK